MTLIEQVVRLHRTFHGLLNRQLAQVSELSLQQLLLLRVVNSGAVRTQSEAADRLLIDAAAACRLVQRLETQGLIARCKGDDRRSMRLEVTEAAQPHTELLAGELHRLERRIQDGMTEQEVATLMRLLEKAQACLDHPEA